MDTAYAHRNLVEAVIRFGRRLREEGFTLSPAHLENTLHGLGVIPVEEKAQFRALLRATMVSNVDELKKFNALFPSFWEGRMPLPELSEDAPTHEGFAGEDGDDSGSSAVGGHSQEDVEDWEIGGSVGEEERLVVAAQGIVDAKREFSELNPEELGRVEALLLRLAQRLGRRLSRRYQMAKRGRNIDFRRSFRCALRYGGEFLVLSCRHPRSIPSRIHLLMDISGSMDVYNRFFLIFMYGLQQVLFNARCFVFSTHLTWISHYLKSAPFPEAWRRVQARSVNWSGGTNIGGSLLRFYTEYLGSGTPQRSLVIIVSDGWDRGSPEKLSQAMGLIHRRCRHLFWLNPLLASQTYEPVCRGMRAALPHIDSFLPFYNLNSLFQLCRKVETCW